MFREALGCFATGVAVVTAAPAADADQSDKFVGAHIGITVNSFTSVSLDPPLLLWCMDRRSHRHDVFVRARGFTVSILGTGHKDVSMRLARPGEHSLDGIELLRTELGPPAIADSLAILECLAEKTIDGGDHTILLGGVLRVSLPSASPPLVFFRSRYSALG